MTETLRIGETEKRKYVKEDNHYVDNDEFCAALVEYRTRYLKWVDGNKEGPRPAYDDKTSKMIYDTCHRTSFQRTFINLPFREDMVMDAVEACIRYAHNFNPETTENAFSYITQIATRAFYRRGRKEGKVERLKAKYVQQMPIDDELLNCVYSDNDAASISDHEDNDRLEFIKSYYNVDFTEEEESKRAEKEEKKRAKEEAKSGSNIGLFDMFASTEVNDVISE